MALNQNNISISTHTNKSLPFEPDDWVTQKIDPLRYEKIFNIYRFYKKFNLEKLGFITTELINQDSELFLKIKKYVKTYSEEWTLSMIKDATLFHLTLFEKLYSMNLALKSSSLQNIFFDYTKPVFSDLTTLSVRDEETLLPLSINDQSLQSVVNKILLVTELIKQNNYLKMRQLLQESNEFILNKKISEIFSKNNFLKNAFENSIKLHTMQLSAKKSFVDQCEYLYDLVLNIKVLPTQIDCSLKDDLLLDNSTSNRNQKQKFVQKIIQNERPDTVLDINTKSGWGAFLAEREGAKVIATGTDESSIDNLYQKAKTQNLKILSLLMPFSNISQNVSCDLVLCLEDLDSIISKQNMTLNDVFKTFCSVTKKTLVLEFANKNDQNEVNSNSYTIDTTINFGLQYFKTVEILDSHPDVSKLLVFKK